MFPFQLEGLDARKGPRLILFKTLRPNAAWKKRWPVMVCPKMRHNCLKSSGKECFSPSNGHKIGAYPIFMYSHIPVRNGHGWLTIPMCCFDHAKIVTITICCRQDTDAYRFLRKAHGSVIISGPLGWSTEIPSSSFSP